MRYTNQKKREGKKGREKVDDFGKRLPAGPEDPTVAETCPSGWVYFF